MDDVLKVRRRIAASILLMRMRHHDVVPSQEAAPSESAAGANSCAGKPSNCLDHSTLVVFLFLVARPLPIALEPELPAWALAVRTMAVLLELEHPQKKSNTASWRHGQPLPPACHLVL